MAGTEDLALPDPRRTAAEAGRPRKIGAERISRVVEEVVMPGLPEHLVMVNLGRPYRLEERLDGRVYRTSGVRFEVPETHVWMIEDGKVMRFESYVDAARMLAALGL